MSVVAAREHERILATARELVGEYGYRAATMERIAEHAGVGKPTLYRWWPNRATLVHEALLDDVPEPAAASAGSLAGDVRAFADGVASFFDRPLVREAWFGIVAELREDGDAWAGVERTWLRPAAEQLRQRLGEAMARGECRPGIDHAVVLDLILGSCMAELAVPPRGRTSRRRRVDSVVAVVLDGLRPS